MAITFSSANLRKLLQVNFYKFSQKNLLVFGIRGASVGAGNTNPTEFRPNQDIVASAPDYLTCKCLLGIWNPVTDEIAVFPGSTVPNLKYIKKQLAHLVSANCMMSGYYNYYEKGFHNPGPAHAHEALRLATNIVLRRSYDDFAYTNTDPIEVGNPHDNIHAAYSDSPSGSFSSAGCQVIAGQPRCAARGAAGNTSYWKAFYDAIYAVSQQQFAYALLRFADADAIVSQANQPMQARLRFGSQGSPVLALQKALARTPTLTNPGEMYFYTTPDGAFGKNTLQAVLAFQKDKFGLDAADGVVGFNTAQALGIALPMI